MRPPFIALAAGMALLVAPQMIQAATDTTPPKPRRPQEEAIAAARLPYREQAVAFDAAPGVRLAGTLTLPNRSGRFAAAILIAGSGRHDRDETVADHKPMLVLADALARQGYAVLRYDKRGAGRSTGDFDAATMADLTSDAAAAVAYLRSRPDIAPSRIGLIGHSEGGTIAAVLAAKDPHLAYVVMMAGFAAPTRTLVAEQIRRIDVVNGTSPVAAAQSYALNIKLFDAIAAAKDQSDAESRVRQVLAAASSAPSAAEADQALMFARMPAMRFILAYDPTPSLRRLRVPALALAGSKDLVVPPDINLPALREALAQDRDVRIVELPGLNHLFQTAQTGAPQEFFSIEETLAPQVMTTMMPWIARHVGSGRR